MSPLISVVIPTYNRVHSVGRALTSALEQTFGNSEVLVVDDASTDETETVVRGFADPRVRYLRMERNTGPSAARNRGIAQAQGEFVAFLDSDDRWYPTKLQKQIDVFRHAPTRVGHVCTGIGQVTRNGAVSRIWLPQQRGDVFSMVLVAASCMGTTSTMLVRRRVLEEIGGWDETLRSCEDWDLGIRIAKVSAIDFVPEVLVDIVVEGDRISGDLKALQQGILGIAAKYRDDIRAQPRDVRARAYQNYANLCWQCRLHRKSIEFMARSIADEPRHAIEYGWRAMRKIGRSRLRRRVSEF